MSIHAHVILCIPTGPPDDISEQIVFIPLHALRLRHIHPPFASQRGLQAPATSPLAQMFRAKSQGSLGDKRPTVVKDVKASRVK